jgi:serine/threonine protein kinase
MPQSTPTLRTQTKDVRDSVLFPLLMEHYQVVGIIGQGGMGTVFKGRHLNLKRDVAIKTLRIDKIATVELVNRFRKEMELIGQMDHPNVVRASDAGERNGVFFLVMEFLQGTDLSTLVARKGSLDLPQACELARQAALGLDYIHRTLVHRDIKPSNLLLTNAGVVKILDLGLACSSLGGGGDHENTPDGCAIGTFSYMAPEQADRAQPIDGRADVYSLGCTLFKLLTGKAPFSGPAYDSVAMQLYAHRHVPLSEVELFPLIPEPLRPLLLRMTAKNPADRCATAREAARELAGFAAGSRPVALLDAAIDGAVLPLPHPMPEELSRLTHAKPHSTSQMATVTSTATSPRRPRWPLVVGVAALLVALGGAGWHFSASLRNPRLDDGKMQAVPPRIARNADGVRLLDEAPADTFFPLLDEPILPLGRLVQSPALWRCDPAREVIDITGPGFLLFPLGNTTRTRFTLEAGVTQSPWTGNVGLFWGYHENAAVKAAKTPNQRFAWFQMISIGLRAASLDKPPQHYASRANAELWYDARGEIKVHTRYMAGHDLPLVEPGQVMLSLEMHHDHLSRAMFGAVELSRLFSMETNNLFEHDAYAGTVGVVSYSSSVTFSKARFMPRSSN